MGTFLKNTSRRSLSILCTLALLLGLLPAMAVPAGAADASTIASPDSIVNDAVSPVGTTINLFDYSVTDQFTETGEAGAGANKNTGINRNRELKIGHTYDNNQDYINYPASYRKIWDGIVENKLGSDGYPVLNSEKSGVDANADLSLNYLFDPDYEFSNLPGGAETPRKNYLGIKGLLQLGEKDDVNSRDTNNVVEYNGYYYYDSQMNFATLADGNTADTENKMTLYAGAAVSGNGGGLETKPVNTAINGQFFPFTKLTDTGVSAEDNSYGYQAGSRDTPNGGYAKLNHYFGMTMTTRFYQQHDGKVSSAENAEDVTYEFSGDDDVWIFIDDVLVADLGGIHEACQVKINFANGNIDISDPDQSYPTTTIKAAFDAADVEFDANGNTFANNTFHTLKLFYLERGGADSNLRLKFNLRSTPETDIKKIDQNGKNVEGAGFGLYVITDTSSEWTEAAFDQNGDVEEADNMAKIAEGETDQNGSLVLRPLDDEDNLLILQDVWSTYDDFISEIPIDKTDPTVTEQRLKLVLVETKIPDGYRTNEKRQYQLYMENVGTPEKPMIGLFSNNYWQTGAYAATKAMTTSLSQITLNADNAQVVLGETDTSGAGIDATRSGGTMFAAIMHKSNNQWYVVTGDSIKGWHRSASPVTPGGGTGDIQTVLTELKGKPLNGIFEPVESGKFSATIEDMPGDLHDYSYILSNNYDEAEYAVAYYYTKGSIVNGQLGNDVDSSNTWLVNSNNFERIFAATLYVPNIENKIVIQRVDEQGDAVVGVSYTLYDVGPKGTSGNSTWDKIEKLTDEQRQELGRALQDPDLKETDGKVNVEVNNETITLTKVDLMKGDEGKPGDPPTTGSLSKEQDGIDAEGSFILPGTYYDIKDGTSNYYLLIENPKEGLAVNSTPVLLNIGQEAQGVYADAGDKNDGVSVYRGVGALVESAAQFATGSLDDGALSHVTAQMFIYDKDGKVSDPKDNWKPADKDNTGDGVTTGKDKLHLEYAKDAAGTEIEYNPVAGTGMNGLGSLLTNEGWSKLEVDQCTEHLPDGSTNLGTKGVDSVTDLFSGSVIVRLTAAGTGDLVVSKEVQNSTGTATANPNQEFEFTVALTDNDATPGTDESPVDLAEDALKLSGNDPYTYTVTTKDQVQPAETNTITLNNSGTFEVGQGATLVSVNNENKLIVKLKKDQTFTIQGLPEGIGYTVTEKFEAGYTPTITVNGVAKTEATGTIALGTNTVAFTNTYAPVTPLQVNTGTYFTVSKTFAPWDWGENPLSNSFQFSMDAKDTDTPEPSNLSISKPISGSSNTGNFGTITYTKPGTYEYTISEVSDTTNSGIIYDQTTYKVVIDVGFKAGSTTELEVKSATTKITIGDTNDSPANNVAAFENKVKTNEATIDGATDFKVTKNFAQWGTVNENFKFTLSIAEAEGEPNNTPMPDTKEVTLTKPTGEGVTSATTTEQNSFGDITYTQPGTYKYTITETRGSTNGVTYDNTVYTVTVTVTYDSTVGLKATPSYTYAKGQATGQSYNYSTDGMVFTNTYDKPSDPTPNPTGLSITKTVSGSGADKDGSFTFRVELDKNLNDTYSNVEFTDGVALVTVQAGHTVTITGLPNGTGYTVTEVDGDGYTVTAENDTGTIKHGTIQKVKFHNHRDGTPSLNTDDHVGYIIGYGDGSVQPEGKITRAEVATIFFRLLTNEARETYWSKTNDYTDVAAEKWYNNAISTLSNMGILDGYDDGSFRPDNPVTRAELTKVAVSFFEYASEDYTYDGRYSDVTGEEWFADYLAAASEFDLVGGYPDGTFGPSRSITRAETCAIVNRTLGRQPHVDHLLDEAVMINWPDNADRDVWYYAHMQEATNSHDFDWTIEGETTVEQWTEKFEERDWAALEKTWSDANDAPGDDVAE